MLRTVIPSLTSFEEFKHLWETKDRPSGQSVFCEIDGVRGLGFSFRLTPACSYYELNGSRYLHTPHAEPGEKTLLITGAEFRGMKIVFETKVVA